LKISLSQSKKGSMFLTGSELFSKSIRPWSYSGKWWIISHQGSIVFVIFQILPFFLLEENSKKEFLSMLEAEISQKWIVKLSIFVVNQNLNVLWDYWCLTLSWWI
jgi:hypothetical protein